MQIVTRKMLGILYRICSLLHVRVRMEEQYARIIPPRAKIGGEFWVHECSRDYPRRAMKCGQLGAGWPLILGKLRDLGLQGRLSFS